MIATDLIFGKRANIQEPPPVISKTLFEGIKTVSTASVLASTLGLLESNILNFEKFNDGIIANIDAPYNLPTRFPELAFKDIDGRAQAIGNEAYLRSPITAFYSPSLHTLGSRCFLGTRSLKYCIIPNVNTVISNPHGHFIFELDGAANLNQLTVCFPPAWETSNGGAMHPEAQYVVNNGGTVTFGDIENYEFLITKPAKVPTPILSGISGTVAHINFTPPTSLNTIKRYELFVNGVFQKNIKTDDVIVFDNPLTSYTIKIQAVDIYYNRSDFSNNLIINTQAEPYPNLTSVFNLGESSGNIISDSYGFADAPVSGVFNLAQTGGKVGNRLYLGSKGSIQVPMHRLGFYKAASINIWIQKDLNTSNSNGSGFMRCNNSNAQGHYKYGNNNIYTDVFASTRTNFLNSEFNIQTMHMVTIAAENGTVNFYQNAVLKRSHAVGSAFSLLWEIFEIGTSGLILSNPNANLDFLGYVEQILFFHKGLTQSEIDYWYNGGLGRVPQLT